MSVSPSKNAPLRGVSIPNLGYRFLLLCIISSLSACSGLAYYAQSVSGHVELMLKRRDIETILRRNQAPDALKARLKTALAIRRFASEKLALPDNASYRSYVGLDRDYVVWNVFAAPELSLEPRSWCFPIIGCLQYRGYFSKASAQREAERLREQHFDVYVGGVAAYSTLGWFDDPLLNTMLRWDDRRLARVIFHELAHQRVYAQNDSTFNESFATVVADAGLKRWMAHMDEAQRKAYSKSERIDREFLGLVMRTRDRLRALYDSTRSAPAKRRRKAEIFSDFRERYRQLRSSWGEYHGYDAWMNEDLNNAKIASVATYHDYVPQLKAVLDHLQGDFTRFYGYAERLAAMTSDARHRCFDALASAATDAWDAGASDACPTLAVARMPQAASRVSRRAMTEP